MPETTHGFVDVPTAIAAFKAGEIIVIIDDEDRENEGDLCIAAEFCTPEAINFMAKHGRGLICLTLTQERVAQLGLPLMSQNNGTRHQTAFTVTARSCALMPVVTPRAASIETVNAVE